MNPTIRLYYVVYDYGESQYEVLDGPFGVRWTAMVCLEEVSKDFDKPQNLKLVYQTVEVTRDE